MELRWGACVALSFVTMGLAASASAQTATAGVTAEVVSPPELAEAAAEWLMSTSPGVFTLRIPGAAQASPITLTAQMPAATNGTIGFFASSEGADALRHLLRQIASSRAAGSGGIYQLSSAAADGTINTHGVQMILMSLEQNGDDSGVIIAIIAFD
jgi:hypothetical protein